MDVAVGGKTLVEMKIQRGNFPEDALLPLLFVITMMLLNHILRIGRRAYKFTNFKKTINHLKYMNDIKLFAKNEKELVTQI